MGFGPADGVGATVRFVREGVTLGRRHSVARIHSAASTLPPSQSQRHGPNLDAVAAGILGLPDGRGNQDEHEPVRPRASGV